MKTRNLTLLTFLLLLLTSCMPDSFTKFKEDPPKKESAGGATTAGGSDGTTAGSTTGSTTGTTTGGEEEETEDVQYEIKSVGFYQSRGDILVFRVADGDDFSLDDVVNVSNDLFGGGTINKQIGTIVAVHAEADGSDGRILAVRLDGADAVDYDDNYSPDPTISIYNNDLTNEPENSIDTGYFIDNCAAGYGACGNGTFAISTVISEVAFLVNSGFPAADVTPNGARKNLHKRIKIVREPGALSASVARFDYTFNDGTTVNGIGVEDSCDNDPMNPLCNGRTDDNTADNDRLVSPYGPFALSSGTDLSGETVLTVNVSLHEDFYGEGLDPEEQGSAQISIVSEVPGTPIEEIQQYRLGYYLQSGQRFAIQVDNALGFSIGHTVRSCRSNLTTNCNSDTSNFVEGKAVVDYVDINNNTIYLAAQDFNGRSSEFSNGRFLYNSDSGTFRTQTTDTHILVRADGGALTIPKEWNDPADATDDPVDALGNPIVFTYLIDEAPTTGFSVDANGDIQILNPGVSIDSRVTISAQHPTTGEIVASYSLTFDFITTPNALRFADLNSSKVIRAGINEDVSEDLVVTSTLNFDGHSSEGEINVGFLELRQPNPLPGGEVPLPASVNLNNDDRRIEFSPGDFVDGSLSYTIEALHPAWDPTTAVTGTITVSFSAATSFDVVTFDQNLNDRLIIEVADASGFTGDANFEVGDNISTPDGARAVIDYIDQERSRLYIRVTQANDGFTGFKPGDLLDKTSSFILGRKVIVDSADAVVKVYDISDSVLDQGNGIVPVTRQEDGSIVTPATGETFTYSITPALPSDLTIAGTPVGAIVQTDPVVGNNPAGLPETIYTLAVTNGNGQSALATFVLSLSESLANPSVGRYQVVKLSSNGDRFYRGTKFATSGGDESKKGRVLLPLDTDGDGSKDSLLLEANGLIEDSVGIDNSAKYFASEGTVVPHRFWYVKDATDFDVGDTVTSNSGAQAEIVHVDTANDRLYVEIKNGSFSVGTDIEEDDVSAQTTIVNIQKYHFVTGVIEVSSGDFGSFTVGAPVTGAGGSEGIVVQKHRGNNNTTDPTDDRYFILVQHTGGPNFFEGQTLNGALTALSIVGPIVDVTISGGAVPANSSSSGRVDRNGNPFFEGNMIGSFRRAAGEDYRSIGFAVHGTDYSSNNITVAVEDFDSPFTQSGTNFIDDFSISQSSVRTQAHNRINGVEMSNLIIGYVGDEFYLQPAVQGNFNYATISPETLPNGLTFDSLTGVISGTPSEGMNGQNFTITYRKSDNTGVTYTFPFVIYNQFEIAHLTDNASSYVLHREGQGLGGSNCKVFGPQLIDDPTDPNYNQAIYGLNDIVCLFEGGESDLFNQGIDFDIKAGNGMCEYVQYVPFSYQGFLPGASNREIVIYDEFTDADKCDDATDGAPGSLTMTGPAGYVTSGDASLFAGGEAMAGRAFGGTYCQSGDCVSSQEASAVCTYDYSQIDPSFPNLDSGSIDVRTVSCTHEEGEDTDDPADGTPNSRRCICTITEPTTIDCGGGTLNGLAGAKVSSDLDVSESSLIIQSYDGILSGGSVRNVASPISRTYGSNRYIANYIDTRNYASSVANSCIGSPYHMDSYASVGNLVEDANGRNNRTAWDNYSSFLDPFGQSAGGLYSNYYTFNCLDAGYDIKARIRILVRDWDREFLPEDHAVTSLINGMDDSVDLAGTPQISISAGSHTASLTAAVDETLSSIGLGTLIYIEDGTTAGLQTDEDIPVEVARYDGATTITLKAAAGMNLGPADFYIRSKQNDDASNSFDNNYDNRADHDSIWNWIDAANLTKVPNYQGCADNNFSDNANDEYTTGGTISMAAGSRTATISVAIPGGEIIPYGSVIEITDGAVVTYLMVTSASGTSITFSNSISYTLGAGATWRLIRRIPFPGEPI